MSFNADHIKWFRDSSPYIDAHRDSTFVIALSCEALESANLGNVVSDIALLSALDVRVVVTFGVTRQVQRALEKDGIEWPHHDDQPVCTPEVLDHVVAISGAEMAKLAARFAKSAPESPMSRREVITSTGSFIKARPVGILNGVDHEHTGNVRRVNSQAINHQLNGSAIVLVPALGYSPSGEIFHINDALLAREVACSLQADKLIYMTGADGLFDTEGRLVTEVDLSDSEGPALALGEKDKTLLSHCDQACHRNVARCHIVSFETDGALIEELFTRDGGGTQIIGHSYEQIRPAVIDDVPGILKLIEPMEASGVLVKRSRELLEAEITRFVVIERDGLLISCAALYEFEGHGELACLVTHPDYRKSDRGDRLLDVIERKARQHRLQQLFVLTTQSEHWFTERGFTECPVDSLPLARKTYYNFQRNSMVLSKPL